MIGIGLCLILTGARVAMAGYDTVVRAIQRRRGHDV